jgi:hypothetical protein
MPPQQYHYGFQPGMLPFQPGQQQQQQQQHHMPPHMMQPSQMHGRPYVMQPQAAQPVKEEKGWFGRLWRGDTVKKANPIPANRLQKGPPHQGQLAFPPQFHPNQQQQQQQQFAHPGPPHMMMMPGHPAQQPQQQQGPNMLQQQQQQLQPQHPQQHQQQQPLTWKPNNGNGTQHPQFPAVNHNNPNQSAMPPPEVLQAIKQKEQRLSQGQAPQGAAGGASSGGGWGKTGGTAPALADSSGYDGSGWGDDDGDFK